MNTMEKEFIISKTISTKNDNTPGILCICGSKMGVWYTRPGIGIIVRGRRCQNENCRYIKKTIEK